MERFTSRARLSGMRTWAAALSVVAMLGVAGCDSDNPQQAHGGPDPTATPTVRTALEKPATVTVRGRMVHVGGAYPGTMGPIKKGTVRFRSSAGTFRDAVDSDGRFEMTVPAGRYYVEGWQAGATTYNCLAGTGEPVMVTGREPAVTVICSWN